MAVFLDTSALLKAYWDEDGTTTVRAILRHPSFERGLVVSAYVHMEVLDQFATKILRDPTHTPRKRTRRRAFERAVEALDTDLGGFVYVPVREDVVARATDLLRMQAHRALNWADHLHLAAAAYMQSVVDDERVVFAASDKALLNAAADLGLHTFNPSTEHDVDTLIRRQTAPPRQIASETLPLFD